MKVVVTVLVLLVLPAGARGQNWLPAPLEVSATGGFDMPTGALNDFYDSGYNLGGQLALRFWPKISLGINGVRHAFSEVAEGDSLTFDVDITIWEITAFASYRFVTGEAVVPYAKAALGVFINDVTARTGGASIQLLDGTEFGLGAGLGLEARLSRRWGAYGEGMYLIDLVEGEDIRLISLRGGLTLFLDARPTGG